MQLKREKVKVLNKTTEIIFWTLIVLAFVLGLIFYGFLVDQMSPLFLVLFSGVSFLLFVAGVFGLLWPKIKPEGETRYIARSIEMGIFFVILLFIHTWILLPMSCPDLGHCLRIFWH